MSKNSDPARASVISVSPPTLRAWVKVSRANGVAGSSGRGRRGGRPRGRHPVSRATRPWYGPISSQNAGASMTSPMRDLRKALGDVYAGKGGSEPRDAAPPLDDDLAKALSA